MPKILLNQTSFTSGELSPKLQGRVDTENYKFGLETATNAIVNKQGSISRRNGFKYIAKTKFESASTKLLKFQYNQDIAYLLEFGDEYIRVFSPTGQKKETSKAINAISKTNPAVVTTSTNHGYTTGDQVYLESIGGMTELNNSEIAYTITVASPTTFSLNSVNSTSYTTYTSGGTTTKIYEVVSPYTAAQVADIHYVQNGAVMYLTHPDVPQQILILNSDLTWTLKEIAFAPIPTYEAGESPLFTLTPSAVTGTGITFTASGASFFDSDAGREIVNLNGTGKALITSITSSTAVVADIIEDFPSTSAIASQSWKLDLSPFSTLTLDRQGATVIVTSAYSSGTNISSSQTAVTSVTILGTPPVIQTPGIYSVVTSTDHNLVIGDSVNLRDDTGVNIGMTVTSVPNTTTFTYNTGILQLVAGPVTLSNPYIIKRSSSTSSAYINTFRSTDLGKYISVNGGLLKITYVNSATQVTTLAVKTITSSTSTANWTLETVNWSGTRGYPRTVGLVQDRLVFGGTAAQPQTLWLSEVGFHTAFGTGADDADSIEITLTSNQVNQLNWIATARDLIIGTAGSEISIDSGSNSGITPSSIRQVPRTFRGSQRQQPLLIGSEIVYLEGATRKIRTFRYDFQLDGYTGENVILGSDHLSDEGLVELAHMSDPESIIFAITPSGDLLSGTYDRELKVVAWTRLEGYGDFKRVQTITDGTTDQVWVIVKRNIGSGITYNIECLTITNGEDDTDGYSDSYTVYSNPTNISSITTGSVTTITSTGHGLSTGDSIVLKGIVDVSTNDIDPTKSLLSSLNEHIYTVTVSSSSVFTIAINTTNYNQGALNTGKVHKRVTTVSNLHHLEGKTVQVKGDGAVQPTKVVSSGSITLDYAAGEVVVGLPYETEIITLDIDYNVGLGSMQGQLTRWARPLLKVHKSTVPLLNGEYLPSRNAGNNLGNKVPLFTGTLEYGNLTWNNTSALTITVSDPLPLKLLSINGAIDSGIK